MYGFPSWGNRLYSRTYNQAVCIGFPYDMSVGQSTSKSIMVCVGYDCSVNLNTYPSSGCLDRGARPSQMTCDIAKCKGDLQ